MRMLKHIKPINEDGGLADIISGLKSFGDWKDGKQNTGEEAQVSGTVEPTVLGDEKKVIELMIKYLNKYGITNPNVQKGIISTVSKESGFKTLREKPYTSSSAQRIRSIFGNRNGIGSLSDEELNDIKKDERSFWERIYGGEWGRKNLGNTETGDGLKYVGRGLNGITGRGVYSSVANTMAKHGTKYDLVRNPEILENNLDAAAEANAAYFYNRLNDPILKRRYNYQDPNQIEDLDTAILVALNANAGSGIDFRNKKSDQNYVKAMAYANKNFRNNTDNIA